MAAALHLASSRVLVLCMQTRKHFTGTLKLNRAIIYVINYTCILLLC